MELNLRISKIFVFLDTNSKLFFPGCALTSTNPELVKSVYLYLNKKDSSIGLWSACCGRPLSQFVDRNSATPFQNKLLKMIPRKENVTIITACGNCFTEFKLITDKFKNIKIESLYDYISNDEWSISNKELFYIHHPCPARSDMDFQESFNDLINKTDLRIESKSIQHHSLSCCLSKTENATNKIANNKDNTFLTYCAHCVKMFQDKIEVRHVLQILFKDETLWSEKNLLIQLLNLLKLKRG